MTEVLDERLIEEVVIATQLTTEEAAPHYATDLAAGADLKACLDAPIILQPGERALIPTGVKVALPKGYELQIRPRSGLSYKHGVTVLNTPGTIDADYRGEIGVILINHGSEPFTVTPWMRIAQAVLATVVVGIYHPVESLDETSRGSGGFGHSGTH